MKIHVLGSPGVGKTTLLQLLKGEPFCDVYEPTQSYVYYDMENAKIRYEVWDSKWDSETVTDYSRSSLVILMFDVTNHNSFQFVRNLYLKIKDQVPVLFMANKREVRTAQVYQPWLHAFQAPVTYMGWSLKYDFDPVYLRYKIVEALDRW